MRANLLAWREEIEAGDIDAIITNAVHEPLAHPMALERAKEMQPVFVQVQQLLAQLETFRIEVEKYTGSRKAEVEPVLKQLQSAAVADAAADGCCCCSC